MDPQTPAPAPADPATVEASARLAELEEDWLMVQMEIEALEEANI